MPTHIPTHMCVGGCAHSLARFVCLCWSTWHRNAELHWTALKWTKMNWTTVTQMHKQASIHTHTYTYGYTQIATRNKNYPTIQYVATKATTPTSCTGVCFQSGPLCHHLITNTIVFTRSLLVYVCVWTLVLWRQENFLQTFIHPI